MKYIFIVLFLFPLFLRAQQVTNVSAMQDGKNIIVSYDLSGKQGQTFTVSLLVSENGGSTWQGPVNSVTGAKGQGITPGTGKRIIWNVLQDREKLQGSAIAFKVRASYAAGGGSGSIEMIFVEGGTFTMGCTSEQGSDCYDSEKPAHKVTLNSFSIGKYEVTQKQWQDVMGSNPSYFGNCDNCPVEMVSWNDVQDFIQRINAKTGSNYRLPTEAEWEYAARGGKQSRGYKYSGSDDINAVAWYTDNSSSKTHAVGQKQANELGIYDMSGNIWEWCSDWYGNYPSYPQNNPTGSESGSYRVSRGGSWFILAQYCRASYRFSDYSPDDRDSNMGFRLVVVP